ncbi:MAG: nucleotide exchange factor GrpE [Patescibacteria group bacterium]
MSKKDEKKNIETDNDDFVIEVEEEAVSSFGDKNTNKIREQLKKVTEEKQEYLAGWQRAKADLINARKDFDEQKKNLLSFANADLIIQIIPVLDSFEMALNHKEEDDSFKQWLQGFSYIYNQLISILESNGIKQMNPLGEIFNPEFHTALETIKVDDKEQENIIMEVVQKGYFLNGKIIREAKVKVGEFLNDKII